MYSGRLRSRRADDRQKRLVPLYYLIDRSHGRSAYEEALYTSDVAQVSASEVQSRSMGFSLHSVCVKAGWAWRT